MKPVVLGVMAHIVSGKAGGPRSEFKPPGGEIDEPGYPVGSSSPKM
ncbi:MAG: hypothetical protein O3B01_08965 [Planctomycetota bacterium]|nr:hypothetical protein [Planctomycetota bacterium]MDA1138701.1 hypothetical protein [Planctomycetota bacterium]